MVASARRTPRTARSFAVLFTIAFVLLLARDSGPVRMAQDLGTGLLIPLQRVVSDAGATAARFVAAISEIEQLRNDNARLRTTVESLSVENVQLREELVAAEQNAALAGVAAKLPYPTVASLVIGRDPSGILRTLTIDVGADKGIRVGDVVVADQGVVGRVTEVGPSFSRVLPITDSASSMVATVQSSRASGIVRGLFGDTLELDWVLQSEQAKVGDVVVTSGLALSSELRSLYPKGLVVGTVVDVQKAEALAYEKAVVKPAVDFRRLERVLVVETNR